jgi:hypothetical protein
VVDVVTRKRVSILNLGPSCNPVNIYRQQPMELQAGFTTNSHLGTSLHPTLASQARFYNSHRPLTYGEEVYRALFDTTDTYSDRDAAFRRFRPVMVGMNLDNVPSLGFSGNATTFSASIPGQDGAVAPPPPPGNPVYFTQPYVDAIPKPDLRGQAGKAASQFTPAQEPQPVSYLQWKPSHDDRYQVAGVEGERYTEMLPSLAITGARAQDEILYKPADAKLRNERGYMTIGRQQSEYEMTQKRKERMYADMYKDDPQLAAIEAIADAAMPAVEQSPMQTDLVPPVLRFHKPVYPPALPSNIVIQNAQTPPDSTTVQTPILWYIPGQVGEMSYPKNVAAVKNSFRRTQMLAETFQDDQQPVITRLQLVPGEITKPCLANCLRYIFDKQYRRNQDYDYPFWEINGMFIVVFVLLLVIVSLLIALIIISNQKQKLLRACIKKTRNQ